jgi:hypothetical protein
MPSSRISAAHEHAAKSGFPASRITPISSVLDPTTASRR